MGITTINGYYLIAIEQGLAVLWLIGVAALGVLCMWLANRPQPRPDDIKWIVEERYHRPVRAMRRKR